MIEVGPQFRRRRVDVIDRHRAPGDDALPVIHREDTLFAVHDEVFRVDTARQGRRQLRSMLSTSTHHSAFMMQLSPHSRNRVSLYC